MVQPVAGRPPLCTPSSRTTSSRYDINYASSDSNHSLSPVNNRPNASSSDEDFASLRSPNENKNTEVQIVLTSHPSIESAQSSIFPSYSSKPHHPIKNPSLTISTRVTEDARETYSNLPIKREGIALNEAKGLDKSPQKSKSKSKTSKKKSSKTAAVQAAEAQVADPIDENVDVLDGYVNVPPSATLPQFPADDQSRNPSSRNSNRKVTRTRSNKSIPKSNSFKLRSPMTSLHSPSSAGASSPDRQPFSLPTFDNFVNTSTRSPPSLKKSTANTLPILNTAIPASALPSLMPSFPRSLTDKSLSPVRLTSLRANGAPTRRISGAPSASEVGYHASTESDSRPTTTYTLESPSVPVQTSSGSRAVMVSTSTRTTDSAGDVYASADSSSLFNLAPPPIPDWVNAGTSKSGVNAPLGRVRSSRSRHRAVSHEVSRTTMESSLVSPTSSINLDCTITPQTPTSDTRTLASLYMVCGLPKDPQCWTLAQPEHLPAHLDGAVPRFWRPEVLGTTLSGQDADLLGNELDKRRRSSSRNNNSGAAGKQPEIVHSQSTTENVLGKEELARIQAKAMKLAFAREVEVIASTVQPPSTTHCFSFVVPAQTSAVTDATGAIGQQWDLSVAGATGGHTTGRPKTYYGACLQVWSHADRARSEAIRRVVEEGSKAKSAAIARAVKAAAAGKRFGARLERATKSPMGPLPTPQGLASRNWAGYASTGAETDTDTDGFCSESEWDGPASLLPVASLPGGTPFWLPYCLVLISRIPIYDLMADHLRISWARYHQAIGKHSQQMLKMLNFPCPKSGEICKMPVGGSQNSSSSTNFVAKIPGKNNLVNGGLEDVDFTMWPVFKSLSLSHLVSIYELALSPMGRIVFFSRYPAMLNMAVETFRVLLELRGWQGLCQSIVHARDVKIYLEDPGPFLLGMNSQLRPIVASGAPPEIMIVDIDTDNIICQNPHPQAFSKGQERLKIVRKLEEVLGTLGGIRGVPSEFHEAFPGGRFRPFSAVEIKETPSEAERLLPPAEWNWDQTKAVMAFDQIMSKVPRRGFAKVFKRKTYRQAAQLDSSAQHVQEIVRKHTTGFVDRRDMLETKIWKLNRRLAFLMAESMEWKQHFETFQKFADKLSVESQDLKTRLEVERRDHHKLSGVVSEQKHKQAELESRLLETEQAWMAAQVELAKAQDVREELERQKQIMVTEMKSIALGDNDESLVEKIVPRVESSYMPSRASTAMSDHGSLTTRNLQRFSFQAESSRHTSGHSQIGAGGSPAPATGTAHTRVGASSGSTDRGSPASRDDRASPHSMRRKSSMAYRCISPDHVFKTPMDELSEFDTDSEATSAISGADERALLSRTAVIETMRSIQGRLEAALRTAGQLDEDELKSYDVGRSRKTQSTMSADSRDSRIIPLQRERRKPTINEQDESETSTSSPDQGELSPQQQGSLGRSESARSKGMPLLRAARNDPRMSAVSLLRPGSSIFGDRPSSSSGTELTTPDNTKLGTVMDGNEIEEIQEHQAKVDVDQEREQAHLPRSFGGAGLKGKVSSNRSLRRVHERIGVESRSSCISPSSRGECSPSPSAYSNYYPHRRRQDTATDDGSSSAASTYNEDEEEEEKFLSAAEEEEEEGLSDLNARVGSTPGRLRKSKGRMVSDISRVSMIGMNPAGTRGRYEEEYEGVTYRGSFMSYDSSSTVKGMPKPSGSSSGSGWR